MHKLNQQQIQKEVVCIQNSSQAQKSTFRAVRSYGKSKNSTSQSSQKQKDRKGNELFEHFANPSEIKFEGKAHSYSKISTYLKYNVKKQESNIDAADLKSSKYPSTLDHSQFTDKAQFSDISIGDKNVQIQYKNGQIQDKCKATQLLGAQLDSIIEKYSKKLQQSTAELYQYNLIQKCQIDKLQKILDKNSNQLRKKQIIIGDLEIKLKNQCKKNEDKCLNYQRQIDSFKKYYEQCFDYTIKRVSDIQQMLDVLSKEITIFDAEQNAITDKIKRIKQSVISIIGNCLLKTVTYKFQSLQKISQIMQQTDNLEKQIKQLNQSSRIMQDYAIKKQAFCEHIDFLKQTLCSWQVQKSVNTDNLFDMQLLQKSMIRNEQNKYSICSQQKKAVVFDGNHKSLKNIEKIVEAVNQKIVKIEGSVKLIESQKQIRLQLSKKMSKRSENNIDERNNSNIMESKSLKIMDHNKIYELKKQLTAYQKKLNEKNKLIYQLEIQINSYKMTVRDLKQQNQSNQARIQQLNKVVQLIEKQLQEQRNIQNGYFKNKQSNHFIRMQGHSSVISFGVGSPTRGAFKPQSPTFSCNTEIIDEQNEQDLEITVQQSQHMQNFIKNNKITENPLQNGLQQMRQLNKALSLQLKQLRSQNEDLLIRIQCLTKQNQGLSHDYQNHVTKFEQQSIAFQKMLKVLRKQNRNIYQQRERLYQEIQTLKRRQIRSKSRNRAANSRERECVRVSPHQNIDRENHRRFAIQQPHIIKPQSSRPLPYPQDYRVSLQDQNKSYQHSEKKHSQVFVHYTSKGSLQKRKQRLLAQKNQLLALSRQSEVQNDSGLKNVDHYRQNYRRITEQMAINSRVEDSSRERKHYLIKNDSKVRVSQNIKQRKPQTSRQYERKQHLEFELQKNDKMSHLQTSRSFEYNLVSKDINSIKDALQFGNFSQPAPCIVDETGYLKHAYKGTYIMNRKGILFRLTRDLLQEAERNGIIKLVH